jgi:antitoxin (DNA-binding transcriptional repressor) of toxin-antitoxin stability system
MKRVVDIEEFRTNLEQFVDETGPGESFLVSVNGEPKVQAVGLPEEEIRLLEDGSE